MLSAKNKIKVIIPESDKTRFVYILEQFHYLTREFDSSPLELMPNNKDYFCVITVKKMAHYTLFVEILYLNGFEVQSKDDKVKEVIDKLNQKQLEELAEFASKVELKKGVNKTHPSLDKLANEGKYLDLVKVSKDITYSPETSKKARGNVSKAVTNAIILNIENASKYKITFDEAISNLLSISTDNELRFCNCGELMIQSANVAFELCTKSSDSLIHLIKIANQKHSDSIINLKAAAKFAEVVFSDEERYKAQIKFASKELNVRWLYNVVEPFRVKLNEEENQSIDKLIDYVRNSFS